MAPIKKTPNLGQAIKIARQADGRRGISATEFVQAQQAARLDGRKAKDVKAVHAFAARHLDSFDRDAQAMLAADHRFRDVFESVPDRWSGRADTLEQPVLGKLFQGRVTGQKIQPGFDTKPEVATALRWLAGQGTPLAYLPRNRNTTPQQLEAFRKTSLKNLIRENKDGSFQVTFNKRDPEGNPISVRVDRSVVTFNGGRANASALGSDANALETLWPLVLDKAYNQTFSTQFVPGRGNVAAPPKTPDQVMELFGLVPGA